VNPELDSCVILGATMIDCTRLRTPVSLFCAALLAPACIIASDDDGPSAESTGGPSTTGPSSTTVTTSPTTTPQTTGTSTDDGDDADTTTGEFPEHCSDNLVEDGGFEGGTPNEAWDEHSDVWGTPICDSTCTEDPGAAAYAGEYFVWFGGLDDRQTDEAWVSQEVEILPETAHLRFRLAISGNDDFMGDNVMVVEIDDETVFMVTDMDQPSYGGGYHVVDVDVSAFAAGESHTLRFAAEFPGTLLTNFFVDEVELVSCEDDAGTGTGTDSSTGDVVDDTTAGDAGTTTGGATTTGDPTTTGEDPTTTGEEPGTTGGAEN
jgi:hypothetical protein